MNFYEKKAIRKGYRLVAGVDEAGRGPLAGPVVAAAVIFTYPPPDIGIKDSKALTSAKRAVLLRPILQEASAVGIGMIWPVVIDELNIHRASLIAMERAISSLKERPQLLLIDGPFPVTSGVPQLPIVKGDSKSVSIAAASIVAKVTRDLIMDGYHRLYPAYNFIKNKGYGTKEHLDALRRFGPSPIHRRTFKGVRSAEDLTGQGRRG